MTRLRRLELRADPSRLTSFDGPTVVEDAQTRLRQLREDVELTRLELLSPESIGVVLLVEPTVSDEDIVEIAARLREILGIGPGIDEEVPDGIGAIRGDFWEEAPRNIGPEGSTCPVCRGLDGGHVPGCPEER
jgi:hypothetical protein